MKSLDCKSRPWNWTESRWAKHQAQCYELFGFFPERPKKPDPEKEHRVMLKSPREIKYVRDMFPNDKSRIDAWLPTNEEIKKIWGSPNEA